MTDQIITIIACAIATYITRAGGHLVLSRFGALNYRVEAALNAVPIAVLTALVAPYAVTNGLAEAAAVCATILISLRYSMVFGVFGGLLILTSLRLI